MGAKDGRKNRDGKSACSLEPAEFRDKADKKVLKSAKECGTQAKKKMEEEIGKYIVCDEMVTRPI